MLSFVKRNTNILRKKHEECSSYGMLDNSIQ